MVMRKLFNSLFVIIAAVVTFAGCTKQEIENYVGDAVTVHFVAESIEVCVWFSGWYDLSDIMDGK